MDWKYSLNVFPFNRAHCERDETQICLYVLLSTIAQRAESHDAHMVGIYTFIVCLYKFPAYFYILLHSIGKIVFLLISRILGMYLSLRTNGKKKNKRCYLDLHREFQHLLDSWVSKFEMYLERVLKHFLKFVLSPTI